MRVSDYEQRFRAGRAIRLVTPGGGIPITIAAPDPGDADFGGIEGATAATIVEWLRALQAWIRVHQELHGWWHQLYRRQNPGGLAVDQRAKVVEALEARLAGVTAALGRADGRLDAARRLAEGLLNDGPTSAGYGRQLMAVLGER